MEAWAAGRPTDNHCRTRRHCIEPAAAQTCPPAPAYLSSPLPAPGKHPVAALLHACAATAKQARRLTCFCPSLTAPVAPSGASSDRRAGGRPGSSTSGVSPSAALKSGALSTSCIGKDGGKCLNQLRDTMRLAGLHLGRLEQQLRLWGGGGKSVHLFQR